jgi:hypothetical protein
MYHKRICSVPVGERIPQIPIDFRHHDGCFLFVFFVFFARVFLPSLFAATFPSARAVLVVGVVLLAAIPFLLLLLLACLDAVQCREQILDRFFKIMLRVPEQSSTSKVASVWSKVASSTIKSKQTYSGIKTGPKTTNLQQ